MLKPLDPAASSKLAKTGKLAVNTASEMLTFYFAVAFMDYWQCAQTQDATLCKQYINSLKQISGHIGFVLFMGAANLTSKGVLKLAGKGAVAQFAAENLGLVGGALASQLFTEFVNHPETKAYFKARYIKDPKEKKEAQDQAEHALWASTVENKQWYEDHVPSLGSMVGGAMLSGASWKVGAAGMNKLSTKVNGLAEERNSRVLGCVAAGLRKLQAIPPWPLKVAQIISFMSFQKLLDSPVNQGWQKITLDSDLKKSRAELTQDVSTMDPKALEQILAGNAQLWDDYRRKKMHPAEEIMARHVGNLNEFDQAINKPYLFYTWFMDGLRPESDAFAHLKEFYYGPNTTPEKIKGDSEKYLRGFFCGPDADHAFHDSEDLHGIPIPFEMSVSVDPFRVAAKADPVTCQMNFEQLKGELKKKDYQEEMRETYANFQVAVNKPRIAKVRFYESRIQTPVIQILRQGVLPGFDSELADLTALKSRASGTPAVQAVNKAIDELKHKQEAAKDLLTYMETPADKRVAPPETLESLLGAIDPSADNETSKVTRYFGGYIIR